MANRIMLNQTSYHGAGAIAEIATEAKAHGFKKLLYVLTGSDQIQCYFQSNRYLRQRRTCLRNLL